MKKSTKNKLLSLRFSGKKNIEIAKAYEAMSQSLMCFTIVWLCLIIKNISFQSKTATRIKS